jgi:hypothetical protein
MNDWEFVLVSIFRPSGVGHYFGFGPTACGCILSPLRGWGGFPKWEWVGTYCFRLLLLAGRREIILVVVETGAVPSGAAFLFGAEADHAAGS